MSEHALDWLRNGPLCYRGIYDLVKSVPENSGKAVREAALKGYGVFLDVCVTNDQHAVVFHEGDMLRMGNIKVNICDLSAKDLKFYKLAGTEEVPPLLTDMLQLIAGQVPVIIVLKGMPESSAMVIRNTLLGYPGHVAVVSADRKILAWFEAHAGTLPRGLWWTLPAKSFLGFPRLKKRDFIVVPQSHLGRADIQRLRRKGALILASGVETAQGAVLVKNSCDNVLFENFRPLNPAMPETVPPVSEADRA